MIKKIGYKWINKMNWRISHSINYESWKTMYKIKWIRTASKKTICTSTKWQHVTAHPRCSLLYTPNHGKHHQPFLLQNFHHFFFFLSSNRGSSEGKKITIKEVFHYLHCITSMRINLLHSKIVTIFMGSLIKLLIMHTKGYKSAYLLLGKSNCSAPQPRNSRK